MQSSNHQDKQKSAASSGSQQNPELSETWRTLLGLQESGALDQPAQADGAQVQSLASDPWSSLTHVQGMQAVDLQKARLHDLHPTASDADVEHALDLMQEAEKPSTSQRKKSGEI